MAHSTFEQLLREQGGFRTQTVTRILPPRQKTSGPRTGAGLNDAARSAGDCFYHAATPLAKFLYSKIEERYAVLPDKPEARMRKASLMAEVKSILNEHRNQIVEGVLPLFDVVVRDADHLLADGEPLPEADIHARDYFSRNVFTMLCRTYTAWLPEFVSAEQRSSAEETLTRLTLVQREKLESELRNYRFGFRLVVAPK